MMPNPLAARDTSGFARTRSALEGQDPAVKILITGAKGFIGRNLSIGLRNRGYADILEYDVDTDPSLLSAYCREVDFVFHLAGVNRPKDQREFVEGNVEFTSALLQSLRQSGKASTVVMSSSVQAALDNPYGRSKRAAEELLLAYGRETGVRVLIYRLPNVFGKWCRPNYNSAVATFCHNIARDLPITVNDRSTVLRLAYIDDVVEEFIAALQGRSDSPGEYCDIPVVHTVTLGQVVDLIRSFREGRAGLSIPDLSDEFGKKLFATYLTYLPEDELSYPLKMNIDRRGSFTEFIRTPDRGQVSVNVSNPGIVKGNHWHQTKHEKFLVVSGEGVIRLRRIDSDRVHEYRVSGCQLEVVDIPPGYTHNIENTGDTAMVTVMWASECFDPDRPDTFFLEV
jgi:UDP-2-acetamido-2,6-beta-L-arabino-hexul-4-ose reductase